MKKLITTAILGLLISTGAYAQNCAASFTFGSTPANPFLVSFNNTSTYSGGGFNAWAVYTWDFGDGNSATSYSASTPVNHTYTMGGTFGACLTITVQDSLNGNLCTSTSCDTILVNATAGVSCSASFTHSTVAGSPNTVVMNNTSSSTGFSNYVNYSWNMGDGTFYNTTSPTHTYANSGQYAVGLTMFIMDTLTGDSCLSYYWDSVYVAPSGGGNPTFCNASFFADSTQSNAGSIILYNNSTPQTSAMYMTSYFWDFGDGNTSTQQYPTHTYASSGIYNLCLTVISVDQNLDTCSDTYCKPVGVDSLGNVYFKTNGPGFTLNVKDPATIGLGEQVLSNVSIYPNPTAGNVTIDLGSQFEGEFAWRMYDLKGVAVAQGSASDFQTLVDVSMLGNGIYVLTVESGDMVSNHKLQILK